MCTALALRYDWHPARTPSHCDCGANFSIEHSLSCPKGGFPTIRHNEIRDLTASLMTEVCNDVQLEPDLQPLTGEQLTYTTANVEDGARLDIAANGFWGGRYERTFIDVRIFNPHAPSNRNSDLATCYRKHERSKKRAYEQRVREVEHASFTPLVLSASGVMGKWGPPKMGTPGPHFTGKMGTRVPIFLVKWGPGSPSSQENGDPGSPFSRKDGDPIWKMGTPSVTDHFVGIQSSFALAITDQMISNENKRM